MLQLPSAVRDSEQELLYLRTTHPIRWPPGFERMSPSNVVSALCEASGGLGR